VIVTKIRGVNWDKNSKSWRAVIAVNRYRYDLGRHKNIDGAIAIRKDAEQARDNGCLKRWAKEHNISSFCVQSRGAVSAEESRSYNMLNKVFGTWRVTGKAENISSKDRNLRFNCECVTCGRKRVLWGAKLRSGNYANCKHRAPRTCYDACVSYIKTANRWRVSKVYNKKTYYLGTFKDAEAARALKDEVNKQSDFLEWYNKKKGADKDV